MHGMCGIEFMQIDSGNVVVVFVFLMLQIIFVNFMQPESSLISLYFLSVYTFLIVLRNACHVFLSSRTFIYELSKYNFNYFIFQGFFNSLQR